MTAEPPTLARKTAPNVRLVEPLKSEASAKAKGLGISLNAFVSIAVRDYLDRQSCDSARDPMAAVFLAELDKVLAAPPARPKRAPRQAAASAVAGRGARLPIKKVERTFHVRRRYGSQLEIFLTCPARFVPTGILGASFHHEYLMAETYSERLWNSKGGGLAVQRYTIRHGTKL